MSDDAPPKRHVDTPTGKGAMSAKPASVIPAPQRSVQYDLFTEFFGQGEYSNTAELWDAIPRYSVSARRQSVMRDEKGRLPIFDHAFDIRGTACRFEITPALMRERDGGQRDYYPSADEELIEEILRKFFTDQNHGIHDPSKVQSWVRFTLSMIRRELKARGHERNLTSIKRSLDIMARTVVTFEFGDKEKGSYTGTILSDVIKVDRHAYREDGKAQWAARLPSLISRSVEDHSYRQFNYGVLMGLQRPFSRWLHKRLSERFLNAGLAHPYHAMLSQMQRNSGLLTRPKIGMNVRIVEETLNELVGAGVLMAWEKEERRGERNRLKDVKFTLTPSVSFIEEMKKMNARHREIDGVFVKHRPKALHGR